MAHFLIRDKKVLQSIILPIFDKYPLLTSKQYNYLLFKKALDISNDNNISQEEKINKMENFSSCPSEYSSNA
jgi:hypothetical protein